MTLLGIIIGGIVCFAMVAIVVSLELRRTADNPEARGRVKVIPLFTGAGIGVLVALVGAFFWSNHQAVKTAEVSVPMDAFLHIESSAAMSGWDSAFMDISAGDNDYFDTSIRAAVNGGEVVKLKTKSGKPATIQVTDAGNQKASVAVTHDGKSVIEEEFGYKAVNTHGFPQIFQPSGIGG